MNTGWVVVCELPQWVMTAKPVRAIILEHHWALHGHYPVNPTLILYQCETRREALKYLKVMGDIRGVTIALPPDESKQTSQCSNELH